MLSPPTRARIPDNGTASEANGTPCDAAYPMVCFEKWLSPDIRKISAKRTRPRSTTAPFETRLASVSPEVTVVAAAIMFLLFICCALFGACIIQFKGVDVCGSGLELLRNPRLLSNRPDKEV